MKKFKNIFIIILALFLTFSLSACNGKVEEPQVIDSLPTEIDHSAG